MIVITHSTVFVGPGIGTFEIRTDTTGFGVMNWVVLITGPGTVETLTSGFGVRVRHAVTVGRG